MSNYCVFIILFHLLFASLLQGATEVTVIMKNGDSITGAPLGENEERVTLDVEYLGEIAVPKSHIANWEAVSAVLPQAEAAVAQAQAPVVDVSGAAQQEEYAEYQPSLAMDWLAFLAEWDNRLQVGLSSHSGRRNKSDFSYRYDSSLKRDAHHFRINAEYYYGKANEVKTSDRYSTKFRWRKNISPGVFYEYNTGYSADAIKQIESNFEQQVGVGTRFVESEAATLSAGLGASGRWRELTNVETEDVVYLVDVFQDWDYRVTERLRLKQDLRMAMPLEEQEDYEISFSASLTSDITESINLSLRYELGYDNSLREEFKQDRRFTSSLGYAF